MTAQGGPRAGRKMAHILLVDDDADLVARNRAALEADGHRVTAASTTTDGLSAARRDTPDLVVLEALLDGATAGVDLARDARPRLPGAPPGSC